MFSLQDLMNHAQRRFGKAGHSKTRKVHGKVMGHIQMNAVSLEGTAPVFKVESGSTVYSLYSFSMQPSHTSSGKSWFTLHGGIPTTEVAAKVTVDPTWVYDLNPAVNTTAGQHTPTTQSPIVVTFMGRGTASGTIGFTSGQTFKVIASLTVTEVEGEYTYGFAIHGVDPSYVLLNSEFVVGAYNGGTMFYTPSAQYGDIVATVGGDRNVFQTPLDPHLADAAFDADKLDGLHARMPDVSTDAPYVPIADGNANPNLDADKLDGKHGIAYALRQNDPDATDATSYVKKADTAADADKLDGKDSTEFMEVVNYTSGIPVANDKQIDYVQIKNAPTALKRRIFNHRVTSQGNFAGYSHQYWGTPAGFEGNNNGELWEFPPDFDEAGFTPDDKPILIILTGHARAGGINWRKIVDVRVSFEQDGSSDKVEGFELGRWNYRATPVADTTTDTKTSFGADGGGSMWFHDYVNNKTALCEHTANILIDDGRRLAGTQAGLRYWQVADKLQDTDWGMKTGMFSGSAPVGFTWVTAANAFSTDWSFDLGGYSWTRSQAMNVPVLMIPFTLWGKGLSGIVTIEVLYYE